MKRIATKNAPAALGPYAQAVDTGTTVYCSGQLGLDPATGALAEGVQAQTHQALKNLQAVLGEAGLTLDSVVKTTVFVQDLGDFGAVNEVYGSYFHGGFPARSCVQNRRPAEKRPCGDRVHRGAVKTHCAGRIPYPPGNISAAANGVGAYRMRPYGVTHVVSAGRKAQRRSRPFPTETDNRQAVGSNGLPVSFISRSLPKIDGCVPLWGGR